MFATLNIAHKWSENPQFSSLAQLTLQWSEEEGGGTATSICSSSMNDVINSPNLLLWQKNRSKEATRFTTVIWGGDQEADVLYLTSILVRAMAEFPGASFSQPDPPPSSRNEGKKRLHEYGTTVVQIMTVMNNDTLSVFSVVGKTFILQLTTSIL